MAFLSIYPSKTHLPIYIFILLSIHLFIYNLSNYLFIYLSIIDLTIFSYIYLFNYLYIYLHILFVSLFIFLCIYLSVYLLQQMYWKNALSNRNIPSITNSQYLRFPLGPGQRSSVQSGARIFPWDFSRMRSKISRLFCFSFRIYQ